MDKNKDIFFQLIHSHIEDFGYHLTIVTGNSPLPRYAYTIGQKDILGFEIIFAGGEFYNGNEIQLIIDKVISELKMTTNPNDEIYINSLGNFKLSPVHKSWTKSLMLGVFDFYKIDEFAALQIIPDSEHFTLDIPNMAIEFNPLTEPVWKWLEEKWGFNVPSNSIVITNIPCLFGDVITEVMRWEIDEWEAFVGSGTEINKKDIRIVSLGTLLGIDPSLEAVLKLKVGKGIWRDNQELIWHDWGNG